jgi:hypothetical protein
MRPHMPPNEIDRSDAATPDADHAIAGPVLARSLKQP